MAVLRRSKKKLIQKKAKKVSKSERDSYHLPVRSEDEQFEGLSEDLLEAWLQLRLLFTRQGEQEIRTSHRSIMFARKTCYVFVRPKKKFLEVNFFLPEALDSELIRKVTAVSKTKYVHVMQITHSDQVERPLTEWIREAYHHAG